MPNLRTIDLKAFVPAKDFALSRRFYVDAGFTLEFEAAGVAGFRHGAVSFLLQDFFVEALALNLMLHLLVEDVDAWWARLDASGIAQVEGVRLMPIERQPWGQRDFVLIDPSGVLWRIGQDTAGAAVATPA